MATQDQAGDEPIGLDERVISTEKLYGDANRWRRFGEPVPAGTSTKPDGSPDFGLFGPGTMVWEVVLHPAVIALESIAQSLLQLTYKPIAAGIRDHDPISRKARAGTVTYFDTFERFQRNAGMHAPMWLGDTPTASKMAGHLHRIHKRVAGPIIDIANPELGGYAASGPRDAMFAALTEMDAMLHIYEACAYHGSEPPRKLSAAQRDQYFLEASAYLRLMGAPEDEIPKNAADVDALYEKYDHLFGESHTIDIIPETGENYKELLTKVTQKNFHPSQMKSIELLKEQFGQLRQPILGALSARARRHAGLNESESELAVQALHATLPAIREMQEETAEKETLRLMWGPDAVNLVNSARNLHRQKSIASLN